MDREDPNFVLGSDLDTVEGVNEKFLSRSSPFRGLVEALRARDLYDRVHQRVPVPVRALMDDPPLGTTWIPALAFQYVFMAVEDMAGLDELRALARASIEGRVLQTMRPVVEGILRLFGASPHGFYKKIPKLMESQITGLTFKYEELGPNEAAITLTYEYLHNARPASFIYWEGAFGITPDLCSRELVSMETTIDPTPPRNRARTVVRWR